LPLGAGSIAHPSPAPPNLDDEIVAEMLKRIGARSIDELFSDIPKQVRLKRALQLGEGEPESVVRRETLAKLAQNMTPPTALCFLGGGVWPHYVPAAVESIMSRQEFYTSYTPYQAEISQGVLQGLFEYQSLMCDLLGMEACNSSMYDWASAAAEAVRMATRVTGRNGILVAGNVGPNRLEVIKSYVQATSAQVDTVDFNHETGQVDINDALAKLNDGVAGVYVENPSYFGCLETGINELIQAVHRRGGLAIVGVDPISLSVVKEPGAYGADIAVGEGQPLGIPMNFGGPHLGIFAVRELALARNMPGRLVGITTAKDSEQKAFSMVLQTREQHIRREAATSNICTNQSLMALAAASYLALLGKTGFKKLGEVILSNSHYAAKQIGKIEGVSCPLFEGPFFKEFVVGYDRNGASSDSIYRELARRGVLAGYPMDGRFNLEKEAGLFCVTEVHSAEDIGRLVAAVEAVV
jgi:glycine dehydrogenase subunit 1